ncbi:MAG: DUF4271 domain-containing protein [Rikenellaceae bacterium]
MKADSLVSVSEFFGENSSVLELDNGFYAHVTNVTNAALADSIIYKFSVIILLLIYTLWLRKNISLTSKILKIKYNHEEISNSGSALDKDTIILSNCLWFLSMGVLLVKILDLTSLEQVNSMYNSSLLKILVLPLCLFSPIIYAFKYFALKTSGLLTLSSDFTNDLLELRNLFIASSSLLLSPIVILGALYNGKFLFILAIIGLLASVFLVILWLYKTYMLFLAKKVSTLNWFLYLCAIEIFPLTLILFFLT